MSRLLRTLPRLRTPRIPSSRAASALATPVLNANRVAASCPFQPGQIIHGFKVKQVQEVPALQLHAVRLEHEATSADYLHIFRDDLNSVFRSVFDVIEFVASGDRKTCVASMETPQRFRNIRRPLGDIRFRERLV